MQFMLLFSRQGKLRLQKWYIPLSDKEKKKITRELVQTVLARKPKMCSFLEWRDLKIVYKRMVHLTPPTHLSEAVSGTFPTHSTHYLFGTAHLYGTVHLTPPTHPSDSVKLTTPLSEFLNCPPDSSHSPLRFCQTDHTPFRVLELPT
ncbi:AP-1 complex subunit sigma-2 isoform X1 [Tachysurus ichikawai]